MRTAIGAVVCVVCGGPWSGGYAPVGTLARFAGMALQAKHVIVHGRVQGVGFRYFVQRAGARLGLMGDVRNCADSTVEIIVEGPARRIEEFLREVREGPPMSWVERLEIHDLPTRGKYHSFLIEGW